MTMVRISYRGCEWKRTMRPIVCRILDGHGKEQMRVDQGQVRVQAGRVGYEGMQAGRNDKT